MEEGSQRIHPKEHAGGDLNMGCVTALMKIRINTDFRLFVCRCKIKCDPVGIDRYNFPIVGSSYQTN